MKFSDFMRAFLGNRDSDSRRIPASTSKDDGVVKTLVLGPPVLITFPFIGEPYVSEPEVAPKDFSNYSDYHSAGGQADYQNWLDDKRW